MPNNRIITFESVYYVMKAEKILRAGGFDVTLIPTPREISSDCGVAIELNSDQPDRVQSLLQEHGLVPVLFGEWKQRR